MIMNPFILRLQIYEKALTIITAIIVLALAVKNDTGPINKHKSVLWRLNQI